MLYKQVKFQFIRITTIFFITLINNKTRLYPTINESLITKYFCSLYTYNFFLEFSLFRLF